MNASVIAKRQMRRLRKLARMATFRNDKKIPLVEISQELVLRGFAGGTHFVHGTNPQFEGGSDLSYDLNALNAEGFVCHAYLHEKKDAWGAVAYDGDALMITTEGLSQIRKMERSWISKAIEKQPVTFLQLLVTVVLAVWTAILSWFTWHVAK